MSMYHQKHSVEELRESLKLAEQLAQLSLSENSSITGISSRKALLLQGTDVAESDGQKRAGPYVPPKQLLLYLVRWVFQIEHLFIYYDLNCNICIKRWKHVCFSLTIKKIISITYYIIYRDIFLCTVYYALIDS